MQLPPGVTFASPEQAATARKEVAGAKSLFTTSRDFIGKHAHLGIGFGINALGVGAAKLGGDDTFTSLGVGALAQGTYELGRSFNKPANSAAWLSTKFAENGRLGSLASSMFTSPLRRVGIGLGIGAFTGAKAGVALGNSQNRFNTVGALGVGAGFAGASYWSASRIASHLRV